jgi:two-component system CheB/CheR fusion protein
MGRGGVLIVEDNTDAAETLADILRLDGVGDVRCAASILEATTLLMTERPSVVVLDLLLGPERAEDFARALRTRSAGIPARVIALSGDATALRRVRGVVDAAFLKPADPLALAKLIKMSASGDLNSLEPDA